MSNLKDGIYTSINPISRNLGTIFSAQMSRISYFINICKYDLVDIIRSGFYLCGFNRYINADESLINFYEFYRCINADESIINFYEFYRCINAGELLTNFYGFYRCINAGGSLINFYGFYRCINAGELFTFFFYFIDV